MKDSHGRTYGVFSLGAVDESRARDLRIDPDLAALLEAFWSADFGDVSRETAAANARVLAAYDPHTTRNSGALVGRYVAHDTSKAEVVINIETSFDRLCTAIWLDGQPRPASVLDKTAPPESRADQAARRLKNGWLDSAGNLNFTDE